VTTYNSQWSVPLREMRRFDQLDQAAQQIDWTIALFRRIGQPVPEFIHRQSLQVRARLDEMRGIRV
jgi:hypothetical protein